MLVEIQVKSETAMFEKIEESIPVKVDFRYCTEALIKNSSIDNKALLPLLWIINMIVKNVSIVVLFWGPGFVMTAIYYLLKTDGN
jgi:steroid 5-alpha reductase family enzyme